MRSTAPRIASVALLAFCGAVMAPATTSATPVPTSALAATTAGASTTTAAVPSDLTLVRTRQSLLGSHTWYAQTYRGIPVLDGFYAVHATGATARVDDGRKAVSGLKATAARGRKASANDKAKSQGNVRITRLVVVPGAAGAAASLAWEVSTDRDKKVLVDADKGSVTKVIDERVYADGQGRSSTPTPSSPCRTSPSPTATTPTRPYPPAPTRA